MAYGCPKPAPGWTFNPQGQGSAATVRDAVDGPAAFAPAALDTATICQLLDGTDLRALADGIRIERATNASGSTRQDLRLYPQYRSWTWSLPAGNLLTKVVIDGTSYAGSNTADTAKTTTVRRRWRKVMIFISSPPTFRPGCRRPNRGPAPRSSPSAEPGCSWRLSSRKSSWCL